ncbi:Lrp/AsnC family transcriptional regulator [Desulfocurvus sp.]|uniref:Lrp/AsnC family transcriptional regulator n=1 Tax=Desulfocurvus sp. TaxID=2871698 RepID=UPI0025B935AD|nr:Lrp/AsnC family transcriptional regulator [Desulfocurvus sp.]MCK9241439.1 Lrp/AsnC family transcriptional regulator [Desulfocurvus sp.]
MNGKTLTLDATDYGIISELQRNGRESYKRIAQRLGVSDGTVRLRTERMMRAGYLRVTASVNPLFFETQISAMVGICLDHPANETIIRRIADMSGVQSVINVTGRYDLLAEVSVSSRRALRRFLVDDLAAVGGVTSTESFVYLEAEGKWVELREHFPAAAPDE